MENNSAPQESNVPTQPPPPLSRNLISYAGWTLLMVGLILLVILILSDIFFYRNHPYNSVVTYLIMPGVLGGAVGLILLGILVEWWRRHRADPNTYPTLPTIDLNLKWQRRRLMIGVVMLTLFFGVSAVGMYEAYHFTESPVFCGLVCHNVMEPEYTGYQHSPHAKVLCTECHIGSGAEWYVKSKITGLYQVYAVTTGNYHLPIKTPVENLRPARDTCEECHWPGKFSGSLVKEIWHFAPDQANTPSRYHMLMKVGGGEPEVGQGHGIHWHISSAVNVRYYARDRQRLDIPWVEVSVAGEETKVFRSPDFEGQDPPPDAIRTMDCIDCHNRPAHIFKSPRQLVDASLAGGVLSTSLPYIRRYATQILETSFETKQEALEAIDKTFRERYEKRMEGARGRELVENNIAWLQDIYSQNFFPEQGVDWRVYPNHLGHFEFPGCYRCHNDQHVEAKTGEVISNDCNLCHDLIDQAQGAATRMPPNYQIRDFQHPRDMVDVWQGRNCTECHGLLEAPAPAAEPELHAGH